MKIIRTLFFLAGLLPAALPSAAQLTINECRRLAMDNYPLIKRYDLIGRQTALAVSNIGKSYLPQVSLSGQASYQSDATNLPNLLQEMLGNNGYDYRGLSKRQYKMAIDVSQIIYDGGNIKARKKLAMEQGLTAKRQNDTDLYAVRRQVDELYFDLLLTDDKIKLNNDLQKLLAANCKKIEAMKDNGTAIQADVDAIQAELLDARQQGTELYSYRRSLTRTLSLFIGKEITEPLVRPVAPIPDRYDNKRPELLLFDARAGQTKARLRLLDTALHPRINIFVGGRYGYPGMDMFADMFSHRPTFNGTAGVRLTWDISPLYTRANDKRKLDIEADEIENAREVFLFNNRLQYIREMEAADKYRRIITEDKEIIALRTSIRRSAETRLEQGTIGVNDLLREITLENRARIMMSMHETEMLKAVYEIKNTINQ